MWFYLFRTEDVSSKTGIPEGEFGTGDKETAGKDGADEMSDSEFRKSLQVGKRIF